MDDTQQELTRIILSDIRGHNRAQDKVDERV